MLCREKVPGEYLREEDGNGASPASQSSLPFVSWSTHPRIPHKIGPLIVTVMPNSRKGHREVKAGGVTTQPTLNTATGTK